MTEEKKKRSLKRTYGRARRGTLSWHRDKAWSAFSLFIRTRDSILTTGGTDRCVCVTCPAVKPRLGRGCIQAGHFIAGRNNSVLFDERGVHGQCYQCNHLKNGNRKQYDLYMIAVYGQEIVDELIFNSHQSIKITTEQYDEIRDNYKKKTEQLLINPELAKLSGIVKVDTDLPF
jgi:hypothetical protein